jgi:hypothetical protein
VELQARGKVQEQLKADPLPRPSELTEVVESSQ